MQSCDPELSGRQLLSRVGGQSGVHAQDRVGGPSKGTVPAEWRAHLHGFRTLQKQGPEPSLSCPRFLLTSPCWSHYPVFLRTSNAILNPSPFPHLADLQPSKIIQSQSRPAKPSPSLNHPPPSVKASLKGSPNMLCFLRHGGSQVALAVTLTKTMSTQAETALHSSHIS